MKRNRSLHMRLTKQEYKHLRYMADECGCTMTEFTMSLIRNAFYAVTFSELEEMVRGYKTERRSEQRLEKEKNSETDIYDEYCRNGVLATEAAFNAMQIQANTEEVEE